MTTFLLALLLQFGPPDSLRNPLVRWNEVYWSCGKMTRESVEEKTVCAPFPPLRCRTIKEIHCVLGISALEQFGKVQKGN